jgi:membrane associated rhomboid family serine protease
VSIATSLKKAAQAEGYTCNDNIPMPIVKLNRWTLVIGILAGLALQWPLVTTALFLILLPAVIFGQRGSLIFKTGKRLMALGLLSSKAEEDGEDRRLMRFNNSIAVTLLGLAQVAFLLGVPVAGWALSLLVVAAASAALMGFCLGCVLFYRFRIYRYRLFGAR